MGRIKSLPEEVKRKIAAGEVIENPASVVKELMENAFDAGAKQIKIYIKGGGKEEIRVIDDGEGMDEEDLRLCYKHHTTSKIQSLQDLLKLSTYGFRGEALASIAQVSLLTIRSKRENSPHGYELQVEGGKEIYLKPSPHQRGTLVSVKNLFFNFPARKKFLKSDRTEFSKIFEIVKGLLIARPEVSLYLFHNGKPYLEWEGGERTSLLSKLFSIPKDSFETLIEKRVRPYEVWMTLTNTSQTFKHARYLYVLVNERWIRDKNLERTIFSMLKQFYGNLGFPAGVIHIKVPPHLVDINVHPAKWEVRFKDEKEVFSALYLALKTLFESQSFFITLPSKEEKTRENVHFSESSQRKESFSEKEILFPKGRVKEDLPLDLSPFQEVRDQEFFSKKNEFSSGINFFGILDGTYLLAEKDGDLYIIDFHALSERIIYEELMQKDFLKFKNSLLFPLRIKLDEKEREIFKERAGLLKDLGIEGKLMGEELVITSSPFFFQEDLEEIVKELLNLPFSDKEIFKKRVCERIACKRARKSGEILSREEAFYLLEKFFSKNLKTCPHGRSISFVIPKREIERRFKRVL